MAHTATVTAKTGPNRTNTAVVHTGLRELHLDIPAKKVQLNLDNVSGNQLKEYDLQGVTTFTITITAGQYAVEIS